MFFSPGQLLLLSSKKSKSQITSAVLPYNARRCQPRKETEKKNLQLGKGHQTNRSIVTESSFNRSGRSRPRPSGKSRPRPSGRSRPRLSRRSILAAANRDRRSLWLKEIIPAEDPDNDSFTGKHCLPETLLISNRQVVTHLGGCLAGLASWLAG